jgi:hypothetical protein
MKDESEILRIHDEDRHESLENEKDILCLVVKMCFGLFLVGMLRGLMRLAHSSTVQTPK